MPVSKINNNKYNTNITMTKNQLIDTVAERAKVSKAEAAKSVNIVLGVIADTLSDGDGEVSVVDFGRFFVKHVPEREARNPRTGEKMTVEAHDKVMFKPSDNMGIYTRKHC